MPESNEGCWLVEAIPAYRDKRDTVSINAELVEAVRDARDFIARFDERDEFEQKIIDRLTELLGRVKPE